MSGPPEIVGEHELAFFFQTNEPVPARPLLNFLYEVERIARTQRHLGPSAVVEITEIRTGTKLARLTFDRKLAVGSLAVAVIALGNDLLARILQPTGRLAESVAEMCLDHGVAECVITTSEAQVRIIRDDLPAIAVVQEKRAALGSFAARKMDPDGAKVTSEASARLAEPLMRRSDEVLMPSEAVLRDGSRGFDERVYTLVGKLRPPGSAGNRVPAQDWQFDTLSGKIYIARGVSPERARIRRSATVVIRAEIVGEEAGYIVLNVKDVFVSEEP